MKSTIKLTVTLLAFSMVFFSSCKKKETEKKVIEKETEKVAYNVKADKSLCESDWFPHSQTKNPAEGKGSPFDVSSTTNTIFHQWSWQKFLWLTKPTTEVTLIPIITRGEPTPIPVKVKIPLFLNPKEVHQVDSHMQPVKQQAGAALVLTDSLQAGSSGVLKTNPTYGTTGKEGTVLYSIHVNPTMKNAAEQFKDSILKGTLAKNNLSSFPVGSFELKVSWVAKNAIKESEQKNYYTTVAAVSRDGKNYKNTEVALLGMHVVGVVENHPEFIWATFEHHDLAPNYNWKEDKAEASADKLLFAKGSTTGIDGILWTGSSAKEKYKAYDLFKYGVPVDTTGAFMKTSQSEPVNFENIQNINTCVKKNLEKEEGPWKNYFYNGSIWIDTDGLTTQQQAELLVKLKGDVHKGTPGSVARGSLNCANVTMETYTQTFQSSLSKVNVETLANCFSCHNAVSYTSDTSPIYMSHLFDAFIKRAEGKSTKQVEDLKAKQEVEEYMKHQL
ncbi:conserved hypothetical protein [Tenacibaculum sp. 190524A02b]|uniref:Lipoprotein n=1 Tax=Tenacibaculum vairaonense TaxID=3137860 RepID=A0ABM9PS82_9FLAO